MGRIEITNMEFYAYHGHYQEEQIVGNKFLVDLSIETDLEPAARSDSLKDALNYQQAYMIVEREMKVKSQLMEHIAGRILDALYREMTGILRAQVKVSKMNPPVGGRVERVSVTIPR